LREGCYGGEEHYVRGRGGNRKKEKRGIIRKTKSEGSLPCGRGFVRRGKHVYKKKKKDH